MGIFQHPFCRKAAKKRKGTLWGKMFLETKSGNAEKTERGTLWFRPVLYVTRETFWFFGSSSLGQRVQFGVFLKFCLTFGRTTLVPSDVSKKKH